MKHLGALTILLAMAGTAMAGITTPEIDSNTAASAVALVSGGLLVLRGRRKK
jgi:hypothetical protein